jgi:putative transposase
LRSVPRRARSDLPSPAIYHVTNRGVNHCDIFLTDADCRRFLALLERVAARSNWRLPAFTLMKNHYHALIAARIEDVSAGLRLLNGAYAQYFNETHDRTGHLFQGRSEVRVLRDDEHLTNACAYIWNNPVRIGRCSAAREWPWSGSIGSAGMSRPDMSGV